MKIRVTCFPFSCSSQKEGDVFQPGDKLSSCQVNGMRHGIDVRDADRHTDWHLFTSENSQKCGQMLSLQLPFFFPFRHVFFVFNQQVSADYHHFGTAYQGNTFYWIYDRLQ